MNAHKVLLIGAAATGVVVVSVGLFGRLRGAAQSSAGEAVAPYLRVGALLAAGVERWRLWADAAALGAEVQSLRQRLAEREIELQAAAAGRQALQELQRQLRLAQTRPGITIAAVLSTGGADGWTQRIRIDKGRRHGLQPDAPVLAPEGLVGRVVTVSASSAEVLLITDSNSRVACSFGPAVPSGRGILQGGGRRADAGAALKMLHTVEPLRVAYLGRELALSNGMEVVTSGLGGVFPPGLRVGRVVRSELEEGALYQRADVAPHVDFASLRWVGVLRRDAVAAGGVAEGASAP